MKRYDYDALGFFDEDLFEEADYEDINESIENTEELLEYNKKLLTKRKTHDKFNEDDSEDDYVQDLTELPIFKTNIDGDQFEVNLWDLGKGKRSNFRYPQMYSPRGINALERRALDREEEKCKNYEAERKADMKM